MIHLNIVLPEYKVIFFLAGKSGNTAVKTAIKAMYGVERPIHSGYQYIDACRALKKKDFFKIAVVRNPWSRFVSCYYQKIVGPKPAQLVKMKNIYKGMSFDAFVDAVRKLPKNIQEQHIRPQVMSMMCDDKFVPNWIVRLENIKSDWKYVQEIMPIQDLVPRNTSEHPPYHECYTEQTKRIIARRYSDDIKILGYKF